MAPQPKGLVKIQIQSKEGQWLTVQTLSGSRLAVQLAVKKALKTRPNIQLARAIEAKTGSMLIRLERSR